MSKIYKKHNSVPVKQWSNVNYSFNKNNDKFLYKNNLSKILNSYFDLTKKTRSFKSKRMRDLIKRFSTTKFYNNEGGIKQNSDKVNLTIYTFDKEKSSQLKTVYDLNKSLTKINKYNIHRLKNMNNINDINNKHFIKLDKKLSLKNIITAFLPTSKILALKKQKLNKSRIENTKKKLKNFKLTKKNNILFSNIYIKNIYRYKKDNFSKKNNKLLNKSKVNLLIKKTNSIKDRKTLNKKKSIMLQNKRNLLYNKLINTLPWSFKNSKIILYKIINLRLFYLYILNSLGISLTFKKLQNTYILYCNSNIYEWNNYKVDNLPTKFSYIKDTKNLYKLINIKIKNRLISKYNLPQSKVLESSRDNRKKLNIISVIAKNITKRKVPKLINKLRLERSIWINNRLEKIMNVTLNTMINNNNINNYNISNITKINKLKKILYKEFKTNNINTLVKYFFDKQLMIIRNIYKQFVNNEKYTSLTNSIKYELNKMYSKKIYLNLVDLKYLQLDANNLIDAVIIKLKNKSNNTLKIIKKSMRLAKLSKLSNLSLDSNLNSFIMNTENINKNIENTNFSNLINEMYNFINKKINNNSDVNLGDKMNSIGTKVEKNNKMFKNKTREVLKNLKHKWITGVKMETKGRLTKRFASSRSVFKHRIKGNLRVRENYNNEDVLKLIKEGNKIYKESPSVMLSRGINIPNIHYVKKSGSRRIGSFGIKLWVNSN